MTQMKIKEERHHKKGTKKLKRKKQGNKGRETDVSKSGGSRVLAVTSCQDGTTRELVKIWRE